MNLRLVGRRNLIANRFDVAEVTRLVGGALQVEAGSDDYHCAVFMS